MEMYGEVIDFDLKRKSDQFYFAAKLKMISVVQKESFLFKFLF